ncbi:zinc ribbon domain-containing protein [Thiohalocapsa halophila]|uniref:zinc ribbon domain-containing protein n=1 Tax=Thiohalocapsa halophila TaxID=69359 RepID=UPI001908AB8E|nr:zinc ribbon domain-containing protein [Thiohalocapsa halophila]
MATIKSLFASASAFVTTVRTTVLRGVGEVRKSPAGQGFDQVVEETADRIGEVARQAWGAVRRSEFGLGVESALDEMAHKVTEAGERVQATARQSWDDARRVVAGAYRGAKEAWEEKREYEAKRERDGGLNEEDAERNEELAKRLREIQRDIGDIKSGLAADALRQGEILTAELSADELSANTGLLATKTCPECGGLMTIRQGKFNVNRKQHSFYWQCISNLRGYHCRTLSIRLEEESLDVVRAANPDLDGSPTERRGIWKQQDVLRRTQRRFETFVGEVDDDLMCPIHVAPLLIQRKLNAGGTLLDSYEHACTAIEANGSPCAFVVPITSFAQIASILRRKTNRGIIDGEAFY